MISIPYDTTAFDRPEVPLPHLWTVRQRIQSPLLHDVESAVRAETRKILSDPRLKPGASVAVGVGSRGINNLVLTVRAVVDELRRHGCEPFIVPAMGSHGGAVAEGQASVLRDYGITQEAVAAPVRATMEVAQVGALADGYPVFFDCNAYSADAVLVINRIKPHTDFVGEIESGICKMLAIGLGKQKGASRIHRFGAMGLRNIMPQVGRKIVQSCNVVGGIALIENAYGQTAEVHALLPDDIGMDRERTLLNRARELSPRLAFDDVDVLVVDQMGKNISGSGMDTHVIGRLEMPSTLESEWSAPRVRVVCTLDITDESHGNAAGLGLADMVTRRLVEKIDWQATMLNHYTSGEGGTRRGRIPLILDTPEMCVRAGIGGCGKGLWEEVKLVRIRNTEFVEKLEVSEALMDEVRRRDDLEILEVARIPDFDRPMAR